MKRDVLPIPPSAILAAVDLSRVSLAAWKQASLLSAAFRTPLEAVFVNEQRPFATVGDERFDLTKPLEREVAGRIREKLGRKVVVHVLEGAAAEGLRSFSARMPGRWLVMGTHGRSGLRRLVLGSVAEAVAIRPPIPVLAVRDQARSIRSILAPVTADLESRRAFEFAAELAWRLGARLTPLHVAASGAARADAAALVSRLQAGLPAALRAGCAPALVVSGRVESAVVAAAARHDLVVLRADREFALSEALSGGTTERILRRSPAPVLVLPADAGLRSGPAGPAARGASGARA